MYKKIVFDVLYLYDFDYGLEDKYGVEYFWYCKMIIENYEFFFVLSKNFINSNGIDLSGCFRNGIRFLLVSIDILEI